MLTTTGAGVAGLDALVVAGGADEVTLLLLSVVRTIPISRATAANTRMSARFGLVLGCDAAGGLPRCDGASAAMLAGARDSPDGSGCVV